jgi:hypothetical protein
MLIDPVELIKHHMYRGHSREEAEKLAEEDLIRLQKLRGDKFERIKRIVEEERLARIREG